SPSPGHHRDLHSFPTRRSSDLEHQVRIEAAGPEARGAGDAAQPIARLLQVEQIAAQRCAGRGDELQALHLALADGCVRFLLQPRSEEHTSELQSPYDLVCRLLL